MAVWGLSGALQSPASQRYANPYTNPGVWSASMDPALASAAGSTFISGRIACQKIPWPVTRNVGSAWVYVNTAGATLTSGQSKIQLCTGAGVLIASAVSADLSATWTSVGLKKVTWTPVSVPADPTGFIYVTFLANGTTPPVLRGASAGGPLCNFPLTVGTDAQSAFLDPTTGRTAVGAVVPASASATQINTIFVAVGA